MRVVDILFWIISPACGAVSAINGIQKGVKAPALDWVSNLNICDFLRIDC
jgi:hypothetical protein